MHYLKNFEIPYSKETATHAAINKYLMALRIDNISYKKQLRI